MAFRQVLYDRGESVICDDEDLRGGGVKGYILQVTLPYNVEVCFFYESTLKSKYAKGQKRQGPYDVEDSSKNVKEQEGWPSMAEEKLVEEKFRFGFSSLNMKRVFLSYGFFYSAETRLTL